MITAARAVLERIEERVLIKNGIKSFSLFRKLIHERDDNIDINAYTTGGKNTFHSMASQSSLYLTSQEIPRKCRNDKTLDFICYPGSPS